MFFFTACRFYVCLFGYWPLLACPSECIPEYCHSFLIFELFKTGLAICTLKNSIKGPMKKAVMIVPAPAIVGMLLTAPPAARNKTRQGSRISDPR